MTEADPIELLFGGMQKLGPGSDADTARVLDLLPAQSHALIVDAGCGAGRQTIVLATRLQTTVHAVDLHEPFLKTLAKLAAANGIEKLIQVNCMDMADIPDVFSDVDLLWSEGAAYNIGFANALNVWREALKPNGFLVVSELCWLRGDAPADVRQFFARAYPDMCGIADNGSIIEHAGYRLLCTHTLPEEAWVEGYYDLLEPRSQALLDHPDASVRDFAAETLEEIRIFARAAGSYGYVFFVLQKA